MGRHSKNNTARANFTSTEYQYLKDRWGSKSSRLGGDSMRNFDQCALCLGTAVDPMTCSEGHLFCKECIFSNLLEQKSDIKAHQASLLRLARQQEEEREKAREHARAKVLSDFERTVGFGANKTTVDTYSPSHKKRKADSQESDRSEIRLSLASLPARAQQLAQEAEDEALAAIEAEQRLSRRNKLPSFWLPSLMPSEKEGDVDLSKVGSSLEPRCRVEKEYGHPISIKSLTAVRFTRVPETSDSVAGSPDEGPSSRPSKQPIICPSCKKAISNSHRLFTVRRCSHTFCNSCAESLIYTPAKAALKASKGEKVDGGEDGQKKSKADIACCPECAEGRIKDLDKDVIKLFREGTGYAASGGAEAKKRGIAFQG